MRSQALAASVLACAALAGVGVGWSQAAGGGDERGGNAAAVADHRDRVNSESGVKFNQNMRRLWSDHAIWTRGYIVAAVANTPDQKAAADRLMQNESDIGSAMAVYYGKETGERLTNLLKEHVALTTDSIRAIKSGDKTRTKELEQRSQRNAEEIAAMLCEANPNFSKSSLEDMMKAHASGLTTLINARVDGKWDKDVKTFDNGYEHILKLADTLVDGTIKQCPDKFPEHQASGR